jgi:energy-converting hydrogenase Eha subunit A
VRQDCRTSVALQRPVMALANSAVSHSSFEKLNSMLKKISLLILVVSACVGAFWNWSDMFARSPALDFLEFLFRGFSGFKLNNKILFALGTFMVVPQIPWQRLFGFLKINLEKSTLRNLVSLHFTILFFGGIFLGNGIMEFAITGRTEKAALASLVGVLFTLMSFMLYWLESVFELFHSTLSNKRYKWLRLFFVALGIVFLYLSIYR